MKYGFYVSGGAGRLIATIEKIIQRGSKVDFIDFVLTDNLGEELKFMSEKYKFEVFDICYDKLGLKGKEQNDFLSERLLQLLAKYNTNYCFVFGNKILKGELLVKYKNKLINFHPSVLPAYKGLAAIDQALKENSFLMGNSAHFINEGIDTGAVIMQNIIHRSQYDGYISLLNNQCMMLLQIMKWLDEERIIMQNGIVHVENADYSIGNYIPQLEI